MLSEQQIAEGWLPHDGGPCPVDYDSRPSVLIAGFTRPHDASGDKARDYVWMHATHVPHAARIIAYKPEPKP